MDKLQLTGQSQGRRSDCMSAIYLFCYESKQPNLKLKTRPNQLLGSLPLAFALSVVRQKFYIIDTWRRSRVLSSILPKTFSSSSLEQDTGFRLSSRHELRYFSARIASLLWSADFKCCSTFSDEGNSFRQIGQLGSAGLADGKGPGWFILSIQVDARCDLE